MTFGKGVSLDMASTTYMKNVSDEELVRLFIESQKDVYFEHLYERYADKVYRLWKTKPKPKTLRMIFSWN